jgi:adenylate cyclase
VASTSTGGSSFVERERKFLVRDVPPLPSTGSTLRQGYVALDGGVGVRIRETDRSSWTLTIKSGGGAVRTEVEWSITIEQFEALWPLTSGRRIEKTRYRLVLGPDVAELDVFGGSLDGLVLVEVEFDDVAELETFTPPDWFGREVTDEPAYTNAALALDGDPRGTPTQAE